MINELQPNGYSEDRKTEWINRLEAQVVLDILAKAEGDVPSAPSYKWDADAEQTLLAPHPYDEIYPAYLSAQIDFNNGEYTRYNNSLAVFEAAWKEFAAFWRREHLPRHTLHRWR